VDIFHGNYNFEWYFPYRDTNNLDHLSWMAMVSECSLGGYKHLNCKKTKSEIH